MLQVMHGGRAIPVFGAVYLSDICIIRDEEFVLAAPLHVSVIAASLRNSATDGETLDVKQRLFVCRKIASVLSVAMNEGHRTVVLGAWGCGAFGGGAQYTKEVASCFADVLRQPEYKSAFDTVAFAIPDCKKCDAFYHEFQVGGVLQVTAMDAASMVLPCLCLTQD